MLHTSEKKTDQNIFLGINSCCIAWTVRSLSFKLIEQYLQSFLLSIMYKHQWSIWGMPTVCFCTAVIFLQKSFKNNVKPSKCEFTKKVVWFSEYRSRQAPPFFLYKHTTSTLNKPTQLYLLFNVRPEELLKQRHVVFFNLKNYRFKIILTLSWRVTRKMPPLPLTECPWLYWYRTI